MALWLVRAGKYGADEEMDLSEGMAIVGFSDIPDLSKINNREELRSLFEEQSDHSKNQISNFNGQLWAFLSRIQIGDLVVLPLKVRSGVAIGKISGPYVFYKGRHVRKVEWIRTDIPRSDLGQDLLYSFGAFMTVCRVERNNAEERVKEMLKGGMDPYLKSKPVSIDEEPYDTDADIKFDLAEQATVQIRRTIETKFRGHNLTRLVDAILKTEGYFTYKAPPGPDGGVDIIAGRGAMGFYPPRLCVQVKSGGPVDDMTVRELEGVMGPLQAEQGLFVSWNGFKNLWTLKGVTSSSKSVFGSHQTL